MAKVRVHVGGTVILEVPDEFVSIDDELLGGMLEEAWSDVGNDILFHRVMQEWRVVGWAGDGEAVDASVL